MQYDTGDNSSICGYIKTFLNSLNDTTTISHSQLRSITVKSIEIGKML